MSHAGSGHRLDVEGCVPRSGAVSAKARSHKEGADFCSVLLGNRATVECGVGGLGEIWDRYCRR